MLASHLISKRMLVSVQVTVQVQGPGPMTGLRLRLWLIGKANDLHLTYDRAIESEASEYILSGRMGVEVGGATYMPSGYYDVLVELLDSLGNLIASDLHADAYRVG